MAAAEPNGNTHDVDELQQAVHASSFRGAAPPVYIGAMNETEILTTIAQLAIGVAGFSGVAIAFKRQPGKLIDVEAYRIAILFSNAFAAMFISLLPFPLHALYAGGSSVWRIGSAVIAIFTAFFLNYYLRKTRRFRREIPQLFHPLQLVMTRS